MKKLILSLILTAAFLLLICPASLAYSDHELPQEIRDYFSADRFAGMSCTNYIYAVLNADTKQSSTS